MELIRGFISPRAARAILEIFRYQKINNINGSIAEIGTYLGKTFIGLALAANQGERVVGVDIFPEGIAEQLNESLRQHVPSGGPGTVHLLKMDSSIISTKQWIELLEKPARFVHIDGNHNHDAVLNDINLASNFLADKSIVLIDDFLHDWYPDVTEGVLNAIRYSKNLRPVAVIPRSGPLTRGGSKLICSTAESAEEYKKLIVNLFSEMRFRRINIAGYNAITFMSAD